MSSLFKTINHSISERISNPFINSFMFSLLLINYKGVFVFIFSESDQKVKIIQNYNIYDDFIIALVFSVSFMFLSGFVWPYLDKLIKRLSFNYVLKGAIEEESKRSDFKSTKEYYSSSEAARLKFEKEVDTWLHERDAYRKIVISQKSEISHLVIDVKKSNEKIKSILSSSQGLVNLSEEASVTLKEINEVMKILEIILVKDEVFKTNQIKKDVFNILARISRSISLYEEKKIKFRLGDFKNIHPRDLDC
ncbi:hypothetical protein [Vibrio mimicus]|uniref:hypothetical protein n=1 Tax=Vibrio mimicus TaxID=674 RepID=UPI002FEFA45B